MIGIRIQVTPSSLGVAAGATQTWATRTGTIFPRATAIPNFTRFAIVFLAAHMM
jgi:hypothetical protein